MALETDHFLDRRRLKRRLNFWRIVAVIAVIAVIAAVLGPAGGLGKGDRVALVEVENIILDDPRLNLAIRELEKDEAVKAVLVAIDSPGGTVVGGESLFAALSTVGREKPVIAVIAGLGTSAGYMVALGAEHIVARPGTITGSIGVILQTTEITGLLGKLGIKALSIKSSPLKAQPNPFEALSEEARKVTQGVVDDIQTMFVNLVAKRRKMPRDKALKLADGRIFTGRQAKDNGLIDQLGGRKEARDWLKATHGVDLSLPLTALKLPAKKTALREFLDDLVGKTSFSERLRLDGLVSLWHPALK